MSREKMAKRIEGLLLDIYKTGLASGREDLAVRAIRDFADAVADDYADDSPRFDRARFINACGF